ncbi:MAG: social motility and stimulation tgl protein [Myxococcales bacterium]
MFTADPRITHIPVTREQVVALHASLNKPSIAVPGKAAQEVQAYIIGVRNPAGYFGLFVYLFLMQSGDAVVYIDHDRLRLDAHAFADAEGEALAFVESMGFMLDNLNYRSLSPEQQQELIQTLPCFTRDPRAVAAVQAAPPPVEDTPQVRLARLLAAF